MVRADGGGGRSATFHHNRADKAPNVPTYLLDDVDGFIVSTSRPVADTTITDHIDHKEL